MNERTPPTKGETWRHFKGNVYQIIAVTNPDFSDELPENFPYLPAVDTETDPPEPLRIFRIGDTFFAWRYRTKDIEKTPYVIYQKLGDEMPWARPLENFMATLTSDKGDRASNYYRFEKINE